MVHHSVILNQAQLILKEQFQQKQSSQDVEYFDYRLTMKEEDIYSLNLYGLAVESMNNYVIERLNSLLSK